MQSKSTRPLAVLLLGLLGLTGCAHRPVNAPLTQVNPETGYYFQTRHQTNNSPEILFILAFSGGGTRAAALAYGVLEELSRSSYEVDGQKRRLLDEVDAISAVSGGSFTAAAYGLYGDELFKTFPDTFLRRNVQAALVRRTLNPFRWPALFSPNWGRSDMAANYYDQILFTNATYADLQRRPGPFIVLNATDLTTGTRFGFTQQRFDYLCSDLSAYPISRACAASSAVPAALSPITLNNYAGSCGFTPPEWVTNPDPKLPRRVRLLARDLRTLLDRTNHAYLHLVDGGVSDNLGLRELLDSAVHVKQTPGLWESLDFSRIKKVIVISANAFSLPERGWGRRKRPPRSLTTGVAASGITLARFSFETLELVDDTLEEWQKEFGPAGERQFYSVMLNFTDFDDANERRFLLNLPTSFVLPPDDTDRLVDAGHRLLRENATYQQFLGDLGAQATSPPPNPAALPE